MKSLVQRGLILIVLMPILITGCCRKVAPPSVSVHNQTDSIREVIVERIVHIHDSVPYYVPVEVMVNVATDTSKLETSLAYSTAYIDSLGLLHHNLQNKKQTIWMPVDVDVQVSDTTHEEYHSVKDADTIYVSVPAQLKKGQKFLIGAGWTFLAALFGAFLYIGYRVWRKFR